MSSVTSRRVRLLVRNGDRRNGGSPVVVVAGNGCVIHFGGWFRDFGVHMYFAAAPSAIDAPQTT
jgi:hypothetical protein